MRAIYLLCTLYLLMFTGLAIAQNTITLEKIWGEREFSQETIDGFQFLQDGVNITRLIEDRIEQFELISGRRTIVIFDGNTYRGLHGFNSFTDDYMFSSNESKILIRSETEKIYRRSTKAHFYVFDRNSKSFLKVFDQGKIRLATFSPDGKKIAFVFENDLFVKDLEKNAITRITNDGKINEVINGATDWVYEEEFAFTRAFEWSPDSEKIAFLRFDESLVKTFTMTTYTGDLYPEYVRFKYPKVGERNSVVTLYIYQVKDRRVIQADFGNQEREYIPRIQWTRDDNQLSVTILNRHQNHLELFLVNAGNGRARLILDEINKYFIEIDDNLTFLKNGRHFIRSSEKNGYRHFYLYNLDGQQVKSLNTGEYDVTKFYGVDEKNGWVYYQAAENSPMVRHVYRVHLENGSKELVTDFQGVNDALFSPTYEHFVWSRSTINEPPSHRIYNKVLEQVRNLEVNESLKAKQLTYDVNKVDFFTFTTPDNVELNGYMIKPHHFNQNRRYPVFMYVYGGPDNQQVTDEWKGETYWWLQMLAKQGYLVACVDNRGTGGRGEEFRKMTYLRLGHFETIDQIATAKYLGALPYTDASRIGIYGWSYGGYMSTSCLLKGNDVFKAAIAGAPVTNWKWYDTIYTERYMRTVEENEQGYRENSPVNFADRLKGRYLLIHGMADDNVHFQHSVEMANALIKANKQFDMVFYPNKAHSIRGDKVSLHLYTEMTEFIFENL